MKSYPESKCFTLLGDHKMLHPSATEAPLERVSALSSGTSLGNLSSTSTFLVACYFLKLFEIIYSLLPFRPSKLPHILPLALQIHGLYFSLIIVTCVLYKYISLNIRITCPVCIMLLVCMFSGLSIWYWMNNWCALPWLRLFLPLSAFLSYL